MKTIWKVKKPAHYLLFHGSHGIRNLTSLSVNQLDHLPSNSIHHWNLHRRCFFVILYYASIRFYVVCTIQIIYGGEIEMQLKHFNIDMKLQFYFLTTSIFFVLWIMMIIELAFSFNYNRILFMWVVVYEFPNKFSNVLNENQLSNQVIIFFTILWNNVWNVVV